MVPGAANTTRPVLGGLTGRRAGWAYVLLAGATAFFFAILVEAPSWAPFTLLTQLLVLAGFVLRRGPFLAYAAGVAVVTAWALMTMAGQAATTVPSVVLVLATVPLMLYLLRGRHELGMAGPRPERLLMELRERLTLSHDVPTLPDPWRVEAHTTPAHGGSFGGDLVVSFLRDNRFEVAIADVSGNGLVAAARAAQLTGALGALVGSVSASEVLERANDYVLRQHWEDGFATMVHVVVDLRTGRYTLGRAGHPAPLVRQHREGLWSFVDGGGAPPLGVVGGIRYPRFAGLLEPGDGIVLYSDGVVESRAVGSTEGERRLRRVAAGVVGLSLEGAAERIASAAPSPDEDRTVVTVWRRAEPEHDLPAAFVTAGA